MWPAFTSYCIHFNGMYVKFIPLHGCHSTSLLCYTKVCLHRRGFPWPCRTDWAPFVLISSRNVTESLNYRVLLTGSSSCFHIGAQALGPRLSSESQNQGNGSPPDLKIRTLHALSLRSISIPLSSSPLGHVHAASAPYRPLPPQHSAIRMRILDELGSRGRLPRS
ncbi:hypothetical protein PILCRDRAFT_608080 [Piloderma croceum F 1598]|uniref:Uncharacterized protein n=1 Tax=Piloderma croceum (strain F 1598) TaxID=765440 RepID=A0A0C3EZM7_PILCF|nr:hypothetical protein PILCRDRAFT_608080 [Piloderma croceum F 1598]